MSAVRPPDWTRRRVSPSIVQIPCLINAALFLARMVNFNLSNLINDLNSSYLFIFPKLYPGLLDLLDILPHNQTPAWPFWQSLIPPPIIRPFQGPTLAR